MDDFIFGTLATDELRLEQVRLLRTGITHNQARSPRAPLPGQSIELELIIGPQHLHDQAWVYWTQDGSDPVGENGVSYNGFASPLKLVDVEWDLLVWGYVRRFKVTLPPQSAGTLLRYRLSAVSHTGPACGEVFADGGAYYACYIAENAPPIWSQEAIIYQVFVDRFYPGEGCSWLNPEKPSGFYGGTLRGITEKLSYLTCLGVNTLWLSPIFPSPSHHGYDATDFFEIEPRLGTKDDLRVLLDTAHSCGLRVLLDFVPNHVSYKHPYFIQATQDEGSLYRGWFTFTHWPDQYETFFGVKSLPQINLRYPPARQHVLDAAAYWLEFGVDGFRVDYTAGPTPDFWAEFRRLTRQVKPDCWTFGEMVYPADQQLAFEGQLDGCLDFMLLEAFRQTFAFGNWSGTRLAAFLDGHEAFFPSSFSRPSFLDNHDMNRILWVLQAQGSVEEAIRRLKLAALCQFTLVGAPIIYYGTEIGLSQERDVRQGRRGILEESRLPMPWVTPDEALLDFYTTLCALRRAEPVLQRGTRQTLHADEHTFVYKRVLGEDTLTIALNLSEHSQVFTLPCSVYNVELATDSVCRAKQLADGVQVTLAGLAGMMMKT